MALPLSLGLIITMPLAKLLGFFEDISLTLINILATIISPRFTLQDAWLCFLSAMQHLVGVILSPFTALFAGVAVFTVLIVDPYKSSKRFADTCRAHPSSSLK